MALGLCLPAAAHATSLTSTELGAAEQDLAQFNEIVFGNVTVNSETEGRAVIGGDITAASGNARFCFNGCTGNTSALALPGGSYTFGALNVFGNIANSGSTTTSFSGDVRVGGQVASGVTVELSHSGNAYVTGGNLGKISDGDLYTPGTTVGTVQNGTAHPNAPAADFALPNFQAAFASPLSDLSAALAGLTPDLTISSNPGSNYVFNATPTLVNGVEVTVYDISAAVLSELQNVAGLNLNGADTVVINVTGQPTALNNLNNFAAANRVIWNFEDATTLAFPNWAGTILAPDAAVSDTSGNITGDVIAASLTQDYEIHSAPFAGDLDFVPTTSTPAVPEPASLSLAGLGLAGLAAVRRLRRSRRA